VLHAQGMDHEDERDARQMEAREVEVLRRFRIADPYR
jgi:probable rRNA maturation factor